VGAGQPNARVELPNVIYDGALGGHSRRDCASPRRAILVLAALSACAASLVSASRATATTPRISVALESAAVAVVPVVLDGSPIDVSMRLPTSRGTICEWLGVYRLSGQPAEGVTACFGESAPSPAASIVLGGRPITIDPGGSGTGFLYATAQLNASRNPLRQRALIVIAVADEGSNPWTLSMTGGMRAHGPVRVGRAGVLSSRTLSGTYVRVPTGPVGDHLTAGKLSGAFATRHPLVGFGFCGSTLHQTCSLDLTSPTHVHHSSQPLLFANLNDRSPGREPGRYTLDVFGLRDENVAMFWLEVPTVH
jgi:hypothetical protein